MTCEACWREVCASDEWHTRLERYHKRYEHCAHSAEEVAGLLARRCPRCNRMTVHQLDKFCTVCNFKEGTGQ